MRKFFLLILPLVFSCTNPHPAEKQTFNTHSEELIDCTDNDYAREEALLQKKSADTLTDTKKSAPAENDCVFDADPYTSTSAAILKYNSDQYFKWDFASASAFMQLNKTDSLILHVGGCNHLSYYAMFITDESKFNNREYLLNKTKWIAKTFFSNGFETEYPNMIEKNSFSENTINEKEITFEVKDHDNDDNKIYEGWSFVKENNKTKIIISGYIN